MPSSGMRERAGSLGSVFSCFASVSKGIGTAAQRRGRRLFRTNPITKKHCLVKKENGSAWIVTSSGHSTAEKEGGSHVEGSASSLLPCKPLVGRRPESSVKTECFARLWSAKNLSVSVTQGDWWKENKAKRRGSLSGQQSQALFPLLMGGVSWKWRLNQLRVVCTEMSFFLLFLSYPCLHFHIPASESSCELPVRKDTRFFGSGIPSFPR